MIKSLILRLVFLAVMYLFKGEIFEIILIVYVWVELVYYYIKDFIRPLWDEIVLLHNKNHEMIGNLINKFKASHNKMHLTGQDQSYSPNDVLNQTNIHFMENSPSGNVDYRLEQTREFAKSGAKIPDKPLYEAHRDKMIAFSESLKNGFPENPPGYFNSLLRDNAKLIAKSENQLLNLPRNNKELFRNNRILFIDTLRELETELRGVYLERNKQLDALDTVKEQINSKAAKHDNPFTHPGDRMPVENTHLYYL